MLVLDNAVLWILHRWIYCIVCNQSKHKKKQSCAAVIHLTGKPQYKNTHMKGQRTGWHWGSEACENKASLSNHVLAHNTSYTAFKCNKSNSLLGVGSGNGPLLKCEKNAVGAVKTKKGRCLSCLQYLKTAGAIRDGDAPTRDFCPL